MYNLFLAESESILKLPMYFFECTEVKKKLCSKNKFKKECFSIKFKK